MVAPQASNIVSGFTTVFGFAVNPMVIVLFVIVAIVAWLVYLAQQDPKNRFDMYDLVMEPTKEGRTASHKKVAFMSVMLVSTWVIVDEEIKHTLTDLIFAAWLTAWVLPLFKDTVKLPGAAGDGDK